jgi:predicted peroxiredoxin
MAKLLFLGVHGSADPTNAAMPFIMANGATQAGHETQIVLANEAVDLMSAVVAENLVPFGWPPFKEILAETLAAKIPIHV